MTRYELKGDDGDYRAEAKEADGEYTVTVNGTEYRVRFDAGNSPGSVTAVISGRPAAVEVTDIGLDRVAFVLDGERFVFQRRAGTTPASSPSSSTAAAGAGTVAAPMPGKVITALVKAGESVKKGDPLVILESMKMEVAVRADRDGVVAEVLVNEGGSVRRGQSLVRLEPS